MTVNLSVHDIETTMVKDLHDGKEPEFTTVDILTVDNDEINLFFNDLEEVIGWALEIVIQAEQKQKEAKK